MQQPPPFGHEEIFTEIIRRVVDTVTAKPAQSTERRGAEKQAAVCSVMSFVPRDPVEAMLAGQCVVYDHLLHDGAKRLLEGMTEELMIRARPGVLGAGKMFLGTLAMLLRMQSRQDMQLAFGSPMPETRAPRATAPAAASAGASGPTPVTATRHNERQQPKAAPVEPPPVEPPPEPLPVEPPPVQFPPVEPPPFAAHDDAPSPEAAASVRSGGQPRASASPAADPAAPAVPPLAKPAEVRASVVSTGAEAPAAASATGATAPADAASPPRFAASEEAALRAVVDAMSAAPRPPLRDYDKRFEAESAASAVRGKS